MDKKLEQNAKVIGTIISDTWKGLALSAGIIAGFFNKLEKDNPCTCDQLADSMGYDTVKVEHWLYYAEKTGFVEKKKDGYILSDLGFLLNQNSPLRDLYGMHQLTEFYMNAAVHSRETFKPNNSLDALSEGKISRDYQPRVSDNLSAVMLNFFKEYQLTAGDKLLDLGCGNGSFLRLFNTMIPGLKLTGVDTNLFAIEIGRKENIRLNLTNDIKLLIGDASEDMDDYKSDSFDWVTAINFHHFYPVGKRYKLVVDMLRIAKKGVFMTEALADVSPIVMPANTLMSLLWNDFTGFFRNTEVEQLNQKIEETFKKYRMEKKDILLGTSNFIAILK